VQFIAEPSSQAIDPLDWRAVAIEPRDFAAVTKELGPDQPFYSFEQQREREGNFTSLGDFCGYGSRHKRMSAHLKEIRKSFQSIGHQNSCSIHRAAAASGSGCLNEVDTVDREFGVGLHRLTDSRAFHPKTKAESIGLLDQLPQSPNETAGIEIAVDRNSLASVVDRLPAMESLVKPDRDLRCGQSKYNFTRKHLPEIFDVSGGPHAQDVAESLKPKSPARDGASRCVRP
jgi:hypothetical protein